ncbi:MAG: DNA helicase PcrA [Syntrophomonadaceae bacterium]|nr:DNA helicase PcrA [Syntrophomonadaceae bacterium]
MKELLANLNPEQVEAVKHVDGPLLVLAGAGTGKTRVLTSRIAHLLALGVRPYQILAITFTNKAAQEMKDRLAMSVGPTALDLWVSTFHAACVRILRREIGVLGYQSNFVIYDTSDQQVLLKNCLKELCFDDKKFPPKAVSHAISQAKNRLLSPDQYSSHASTWYEQETARVYHLYQHRLRGFNACDFDDLIMKTVELFTRYPDVLAYYQEKFKYILVDEYQDTNHAQYKLVQLLSKEHHNLCVVGDPDQSIYRWRGADIQNILDFERDYPEAAVIRLEQNYRSTGNILAAANAVIACNTNRKHKNLWTDQNNGHPIVFFTGESEWAEARFVIDEIMRFHQQEGISYRNFAVLYRTHAQSRVLEEMLMQKGLPYQILGGLRFYERKEIKDLLAYLRVLQNPADSISLQRIINVPRRGIGEATWSRLEMAAIQQGLAVIEVLDRPDIGGRTAKALGLFKQLIEDLSEARSRLTVTELVDKVLLDTGYLRELEAENTPEAWARLENLQEFKSVTRNYDQNSEERTLEGFLAQVSLVADIDTYAEGDAVVLMTLHSAKGLEYPLVFLVGMEEGIFPHNQALLDEAELEEERRLCYVGMTRAQQKLYLSCARERTLYGNLVANEQSRFIKEVPEKLLLVEGNSSRLHGGPASGFGLRQEAWQPNKIRGQAVKTAGEKALSFNLGDRVEHSKWGEGVVVKVHGEGADGKITVAFPDQGLKELLIGYAPLKKI